MAIAPPLPASSALAMPGIEFARSEWRRNSNNTYHQAVRLYNASGGTLTVGAVYRMHYSGAAATTHNPQVTAVAAVQGRPQRFVVALEATVNNAWGWFAAWGWVDILVEGTTDVLIDDLLQAVTGQTYLVKAGSINPAVVAEAGAGQTSATPTLTRCFLRGDPAVILDISPEQYGEVTVTAAEILDLADTPKELVAAPGAGKVLEFLGAALFLDHAGTGFTETSDNLVVKYEQESGVSASEVIEMTGFIDQTADTMTFAVPDGGAATAIVAKTGCENKALVLVNPNDDFADGGTTTSVLRIKIRYRTHTTGW